MLRDNLVGLIEPMLSGAGAYPLALRTNRKRSSDDRPACLENPRPAGAESTLTENVASPFHAEPGHGDSLTEGRLVPVCKQSSERLRLVSTHCPITSCWWKGSSTRKRILISFTSILIMCVTLELDLKMCLV